MFSIPTLSPLFYKRMNVKQERCLHQEHRFVMLIALFGTSTVIARLAYLARFKGPDKREMFGDQTPSNIVW